MTDLNPQNAGDQETAGAAQVDASANRHAKGTETPVVRLDGAILKQTLEAPEYSELKVNFDAGQRVLWYGMNPSLRPSATVGLMQDIRQMQDTIRSVFERSPEVLTSPVRYMVLTSDMPQIFNLGGDLNLFSKLIQQRNRRALQSYARLSIGVIHANSINLNLPLITISLVEGDALGGGFEAALSSNLLIAERGTKFGLPEILFNLFPGMGGYSFLARKIEPRGGGENDFQRRHIRCRTAFRNGYCRYSRRKGRGTAGGLRLYRNQRQSPFGAPGDIQGSAADPSGRVRGNGGYCRYLGRSRAWLWTRPIYAAWTGSPERKTEGGRKLNRPQLSKISTPRPDRISRPYLGRIWFFSSLGGIARRHFTRQGITRRLIGKT